MNEAEEHLRFLVDRLLDEALVKYDAYIERLYQDNDDLRLRFSEMKDKLIEQRNKYNAAWAAAHKQYTIAVGKAFAENEQLRGEIVVLKEKLQFADESYLRLKQIHWLKQRPDADIESLTAEENDILKALGVDNQE